MCVELPSFSRNLQQRDSLHWSPSIINYLKRKSNAEQWLRKYEENNPEKTDVPQLLEQAEAHNKKHSLVEQYMEKKQQYDAVIDKSPAKCQILK